LPGSRARVDTDGADPDVRLEASFDVVAPPSAADAARLAALQAAQAARGRTAHRTLPLVLTDPDLSHGDFSTAPPSPRAAPPPPPFPSPRSLPPPVFNALYDYANYSLGPEQRPGNGVPTRAEAPGLYAQESPPAVGEGPRAPPPAAVRARRPPRAGPVGVRAGRRRGCHSSGACC